MTELTDLLPTTDELVRLRAVAAGHTAPDVIVRGGLVQSPGTEEWLERDVLIAGRHIATLTPWGHVTGATTEIDARGAHVVPGFIDAHLHIEYTNLTPGELARLSVARGTTTVLTDPNGAANVWGAAGMDLLLQTGTPLHVFQQVSPTTPTSADLELGGAVISEEVVRGRLHDDVTITLGESNPFDYGDVSTGRFREALVAGRRLTGHTAAQTHESLWGYLAAGISDDHNAATVDEVLERTRLGAMITVMGSSLTDNTVPLFADLDAIDPALRHLSFCADDKHVHDLHTEGHIDHHVRQAIRFGVDPQLAYRMATTQPAQYYRLDQVLGLLAPSRLADLQIIPDLADVRPRTVIVAGEVVAQDGAALFANTDELPAWTRGTVRLPNELPGDLFSVPTDADADTASVRAMEMYNGYFKRAFTATLRVRGGEVVSDPTQDVLKIAVVDRHQGDAISGIGFVKGFGLRRGAIAITMNCPNMNISVVGADDASMRLAVEELGRMDGGFVTVADGEVVARVPLPIGGMMSDAPFEETAAALAAGHAATHALGCRIPSPYIILSFVGLYVVPDLGLTERGLIDAATQQFVDVLLPGPVDACGIPHDHGSHS
ncbi:amidohydrolase family protein [Microbacterium sp. cx-55]|uniref:adenine deaminase C-terminal domain-containing protein n=1 Tax=Microbacterium sp. cx-55 TaxID=2875948 RepID=UPI001CBF96AC|nr:adenine deaminase C-terminal domain-containing protein [Microbacterium sp. cx-55]MBZ4487455.1 amidohydrolase family protein [Microbacterium sp. cx-55]UGB35475.1 amidohydrolase family protein [Microbacterium sp. cx-55]